jgi:hypothetical protein
MVSRKALWALACATLAHHARVLRLGDAGGEDVLVAARLRDGLELMGYFAESSGLMGNYACMGSSLRLLTSRTGYHLLAVQHLKP